MGARSAPKPTSVNTDYRHRLAHTDERAVGLNEKADKKSAWVSIIMFPLRFLHLVTYGVSRSRERGKFCGRRPSSL